MGTANNCVISGNTAISKGGGIYYGTANNCTISKNLSGAYGGGMCLGTANNCTISGNRSAVGGGIKEGTANNCIIWYNTASSSGQNIYHATSASYSCSPDLTDGTDNNITNAPMFIDKANGDYSLPCTSPCIDTGEVLSGITYDLIGTPRPLDGDADGSAIPDMGCYEFINAVADSDGDTMIDSWENENGLDMIVDDGSGNPDNDPYINAEEYTLDYDPNISNDWFQITAISNSAPITVIFNSSLLRNYTLLSSTNLTKGTWSPVVGPRTGTGGNDSMQESTNSTSKFYQIQVNLP